MTQATITVQALSKRYADVLAVNAVSFEVMPGSICALLGGNGAGKTTLLSMLLGLLLPEVAGCVLTRAAHPRPRSE